MTEVAVAPLEPKLREVAGSRDDGRRVRILKASQVPPEPVSWCWGGRIPRRALTLLVGREGLGKTTAAVEVAARLTRGELEGDLWGEPASCLFATAEDSLSTTLVPRLLAAGADLERVAFVTAERDGEEDGLTLPDDAEELAQRAGEFEAKLIVVDPLVAFLPGGINSWRDQDVRRAIAPLARTADRLDGSFLVLVHLNKREGADVLSRVSGSTGFTAAARSVLVLGPDPDAPDSPARVLAHAKSNLSPIAPSTACRVEGRTVHGDDGEAIETSRLVLGGERDVAARDLLAVPGDEERGERTEAREFLAAELADGPLAASEVERRAREAGISPRTLRRAKDDLGVFSKQGTVGSRRLWRWTLPEVAE